MKKRLLIVLTLLLCLACLNALADQPLYIDGKTSDRVHLRAQPGEDAASMGLYFTGTVAVPGAGSVPGWTKVRIGVQEGYVKNEYLSSVPVASMEMQGIVQVDSGKLNVRPTPSTDRTPVGRLANGAAILVHGETKSGWYYVYTGQCDGYVMKEFVKLVEVQTPQGGIPDAALYRSVISGEMPLWNLDTQRLEYASGVLDEQGPGSDFTGFALLDFDGDSVREAVMRIGDDYGALLLKASGNTVYGCILYYRAFNAPKEDGTFSFASSAFESGFGYITLGPDGAKTNALACSMWDGNENTSYMVYGKRATAASFEEALRSQAVKRGLVWHDIAELSCLLVP